MVLGHELLLEVADDAQELSLGVIIDFLGANLVEQRAKAIVHVLDELGTERQHVGDPQVIQEALVETVGCSGMTHSAAMAAEILPGLTVLEALNTDLVCDAINTAMRELFLQIAYGRSQTAFSDNGLPVGAGLDDLGKGLRSQVGTLYGTLKKGPRYLELAEGYVTKLALDNEGRIIGYEVVQLGKVMEAVRAGKDANEAIKANTSTKGRFKDGVKFIDPREE